MSETPRSWQVGLASVLVGMGALVGLGMVVLAFALLRGDPGFLFAVLPILFLVLSVAGITIGAFSLGLVVRLRRAQPGVRLQVALLGGSLAVCGLFVGTASAPAAAFLLVYGGTLLWLMTTSAAASGLGPWIAPAPRRKWFGAARSSTVTPWWETWRAGLGQGMPLWELVLVGAAIAVFVVGLLWLQVGFFLFPSYAPLAVPVMLGAAAAIWLVERRMKARLAASAGS